MNQYSIFALFWAVSVIGIVIYFVRNPISRGLPRYENPPPPPPIKIEENSKNGLLMKEQIVRMTSDEVREYLFVNWTELKDRSDKKWFRAHLDRSRDIDLLAVAIYISI